MEFKRRKKNTESKTKEVKEEEIRDSEEQTFQDGTLDDGIIPSPEGPRGGNSPDWPKPERDHGHVGEMDE